MKWSSLLYIPLLVAAATAKISDQAFLSELAADGNGVIALDEMSYEKLTNKNRNWSATVQFTARHPSRRCGPCTEFNPSFAAVAKAWSKVAKEQRDQHFFGTVDFDDAPKVFTKLGLTSAPIVQIYTAAKGPRAAKQGGLPLQYDMSEGFGAAPFAEAQSKFTPVAIPYRDPVDYAKILSIASISITFALVLRFSAPLLRNKWLWAIGVVSTSLVMTSGFMFVRIRNMPMTSGSGGWIAGGYSNQYGQEIYLVSGLYGILALSFLMLTFVVPLSPPGRQRIQVFLWSGVIVIFFSILLSVFKQKNGGYPFKLLL